MTASRNRQVGTRMYTTEALALFGALCLTMAENGFLLIANGGMSVRIAIEQIEKNVELRPSGDDINNVEVLCMYAGSFCRSGGRVGPLPRDLESVMGAFVKSRPHA